MKNIALMLTLATLASCGGAKLPAVDPQTIGMPVVSEIGESFGDAIAFTWTTPEGDKGSFGPSKDYTILTFWKYGCSNCIPEVENINMASGQYKDVHFLTICINPPDSLDSTISILQSLDLETPIVFDPGSNLADKYSVSTIPDLMLLDGDGKIIKRKKAGVTVDNLLEMIDLIPQGGGK